MDSRFRCYLPSVPAPELVQRPVPSCKTSHLYEITQRYRDRTGHKSLIQHLSTLVVVHTTLRQD